MGGRAKPRERNCGPRPPVTIRRALASRNGWASMLAGLWPAMKRRGFCPTATCVLLLDMRMCVHGWRVGLVRNRCALDYYLWFSCDCSCECTELHHRASTLLRLSIVTKLLALWGDWAGRCFRLSINESGVLFSFHLNRSFFTWILCCILSGFSSGFQLDVTISE